MADPDYFTLTEFRLLPDVASTSDYPDAKVLAAAAYFVDIVEREVGHPFIPRSYTENLRGNGSTALVLSHPYIQSLTTVTVGGVSVNVAGLDATSGILRYATTTAFGTTAWTYGAAVVVTYSAGPYATCPDDIKDSVMWATRDRLISQSELSGSWDRKTSVSNEFGTTQYVLPGEKRPTGYPELDALIASYCRTTAAFGFA